MFLNLVVILIVGMKILYYYRRWECFGRDWYIDDCSFGFFICGCIYFFYEVWRWLGDIFFDILFVGIDLFY